MGVAASKHSRYSHTLLYLYISIKSEVKKQAGEWRFDIHMIIVSWKLAPKESQIQI